MYLTGVSQVVQMRDVHKLQQDIDNDPIITNQMDNLGCLLARTFVNFPAFVLVAVHTITSLWMWKWRFSKWINTQEIPYLVLMLNYKLQALEMVDNFTIDLLNCVTMMVGEGVFEMGDKMSFLTPFTFNAVELHTVPINGNHSTGAKEVCRTLEYGKTTKDGEVLRCLCSSKNCDWKSQLIEFISETNLMDWPKNSGKGSYYINEQEM